MQFAIGYFSEVPLIDRANMTEYYEVIGTTIVNLTDSVEGAIHGETNLGNAVTDSMAAVFEDADIAFTNDGSLR